MNKILITGGTGFVGKALSKKLISNRFLVNISTRTDKLINLKEVISYNIGEIDHKTDWTNALNKVDCVIHCAAKTQVMNELEKDKLDDFKKVNIHGTINLAEQAASNGIKRFIFLSSIKVNGEKTLKSSSFKNYDIAKPEDTYGISKWEAEQELWKISKRTKLEVIIIRSPLVYGHEVKGNLMSLMKLINSGIPLPFGLIKNQRSLVGIDNLVDLIALCIDHPDAAEKTFLVSDGEDLSTPDLINYIATSMGCRAHLFPLPIFLLKFLGSIFGKQKEINRLVGSLRIDNSFVKETLNWTPPLSIEEGIRRMVKGK